MSLSKESIQCVIDALVTEVIQRYAGDKNINHTEALRFLMGTKTYKLLNDPESFLYLESIEYVLDMLDAEIQGDTERWVEVQYYDVKPCYIYAS